MRYDKDKDEVVATMEELVQFAFVLAEAKADDEVICPLLDRECADNCALNMGGCAIANIYYM